MTTSTVRTSSDGRRAPATTLPPRALASPAARRRQVPLVVVGVLLVVGCALVFADVTARAGTGEEALVATRPLAAGQVLQAGDLQAARVSGGTGVAIVPAASETQVVGHRLAVPVVAGALLDPADVGAAQPAGSDDVVAMGLKAGAYPPGLAVGDRVEVVPVASSATSGSGTAPTSGTPLPATVLGVDPGAASSDTPTVFSLSVAKGAAGEVASLAAAGQGSLVEVGGGG